MQGRESSVWIVWTRTAIVALLFASAFDHALAQEGTPEPTAAGSPKNNWTAQITASDASGSTSQNQPPHSNYDADIYENLNYSSPVARRSDISQIAGGIDRGFLYFSIGTVEGWSDASQAVSVGIELEAGQSGRGDVYLRIDMLAEFNDRERWKDAERVATYVLSTDNNNNVGGSDPDAVDANPGDGYENRIGVARGVVFARVMDNGSFEIALERSAIQLEDANYFRFRVWTEQAGNDLERGTFSFHDHLPIMSIGNIDSYPGVNTETWLVISDLEADAIDIAISQVVDPPYSREGDTVVFTTTASHNFGNHTAEDVQVDFVLPRGLSLVSVDAGAGQWDGVRNKWTLATLAPGAQSSFVTTAVIDAREKGNQLDAEATLKKVRQDDFNDVNNVGGSTVYVVGHDGTIEFKGDMNGAPLGPVYPGQDLFVHVSDPDLNAISLAIETIVVTVFSQATGDAVALTLTETALASGIFAGSSETEVDRNATSGDGVLQVTSTDTVTALYVDLLDSQFNKNALRSDTLSYQQTAPLITLVNYADKAAVKPGDALTYRVDFVNAGASAALDLLVQGQIPGHTAYVPGSMRAGTFGSDYASAQSLTDDDDEEDAVINGISVAGHFDGQKIAVSVARVEASDGITDSGPDSGTVFYQVRVE